MVFVELLMKEYNMFFFLFVLLFFLLYIINKWSINKKEIFYEYKNILFVNINMMIKGFF